MSFELIINSKPNEVDIALLKDKKLIELHKEKHNKDFSVGDIYLGKIRKVVPSLNAAFVDVGYEKDAFLHYLDLGPQFLSMKKYFDGSINGAQKTSNLSYNKISKDIEKDGKIADILSANQLITVQIAKEPISSKGPRLSAEVTLAGRYIVLVPFSDKISISQKIKDPAEKERLKRLISSIKPKNFGVIIRTVAQNRKVADLDQDMSDLMSKWESMHKSLRNAVPVKRILGEMNRTSTVLRDILTEEFTSIKVNDGALFEEIKSYVQTIAPKKVGIVKHYTGKVNIYEQLGITKQIKASFGKKVMLSSGAYLIIEHTEAMHVIDVNSGNRKASVQNQEQNAFETNIEVAHEIARILRLRDMGGIVAIDFIDMHKKENNHKLYETLREAMRSDRAKHNIIPPTRFGVIELTRQRVRPVTDIKTAETCPTCKGTGEVESSILIIDEIENSLRYHLEEYKGSDLTLQVHPFIEAYLKRGLKSIQRTWFLNQKKWVPVKGVADFTLLQYQFVNSKNEVIEL
ncbi:MAG: Rne/Rng family ribonuclease [Flavobacteriales bacterium]|nr:Rne/Rng family ribonuclease [Flavobacteriales bacterium]